MFTRHRKNLSTAAIVTLIAAWSSTSFAQDYKLGTLEIEKPVARATAPGAKVGGGYLVIRNTGDSADRLIGGSAGFAGKIEIHEMKIENDVMRMRPLENGLEIPPGGDVKLVPGGNHIMFLQLQEILSVGEKRTTTLTFEKSGSVEVDFEILSIADTMKLKAKDTIMKKKSHGSGSDDDGDSDG